MLTEAEAEMYRLASEEMGGRDHCYITVESDGTYTAGAAGHHSLLLREERMLHESLFRRPDGVEVLVATSTLAQGMNLPSELVIIAGDSRFDPAVDKMAQLEAHELLNAAGRAGRAGESSQGIVLVVASKVVEFDQDAGLIGAHWMTLQSIFSQSDQCLDIDDPTTALLDRIQAGASEDSMPAYFVSRLPPADADGSDASLRNIVGRSLAAYQARQRDDAAWIEERIQAAFSARNKVQVPAGEEWLDKVSGLTGMSVAQLREITAIFDSDAAYESTRSAIKALIDWLGDHSEYVLEVFRPENVHDLFGGEFAKLSAAEKGKYALPIIADLLDHWMQGAPLNEIEARYPDGPDRGKCKHARHFALRLVPDIAFLAGLPARLLAARQSAQGQEVAVPLTLSTLASAVRQGCDSPECLAVRAISSHRMVSRVGARARYEAIASHIKQADKAESFEETIQRVRTAAALLSFEGIDFGD